MMRADLVFRAQPAAAPDGLRSRKKVKTRVAIQDAALELFVAQGYEATTIEQIAERAEVSTTTFFRYFPSKAEVVLSDHGQQLPELHQAIIDRPAGESDLVAVRHALHREWVGAVDAERSARKAKVIASSDALSGLSYHRGHRWREVVADALARRNGLDTPDERCLLAARVMLSVLATASESWLAAGCHDDLARVLDRHFDLMTELCGAWSIHEPIPRGNER